MMAVKKKVCILIGTLGSGGAEKQTCYYIMKIINEYNVQVVAFAGGIWCDYLKKHNVPVHLVGEVSVPRKFLRLVKLLSEIKPDLIHSIAFRGNFFARLVSAVLRKRKYRLLVSERNTLEYKPKWIVFIEKYLDKYVDLTIVNSEYTYQQFKNCGFDERKIYTIKNGVEYKRCTPYLERKFEFDLTYVANFSWRKNHQFLLKALKRLAINKPDLNIALIGRGQLQLEEIRKLVTNYGLDDNIIFLTNCDNVHRVLCRTKIYVHPSLYEGMSNSIMEALSFGVPVIAFDICSNSELVIDRKNGLLVEKNNMEEFCNAVMSLIDNEQNLALFSKYGIKYMKEKYSMEKMVVSTKQLYKKII